MSDRTLSWIKARASYGSNACVELAEHDGMVLLRNSRDPANVLTFTRDEVDVFVRGAATGDFDCLLDPFSHDATARRAAPSPVLEEPPES